MRGFIFCILYMFVSVFVCPSPYIRIRPTTCRFCLLIRLPEPTRPPLPFFFCGYSFNLSTVESFPSEKSEHLTTQCFKVPEQRHTLPPTTYLSILLNLATVLYLRSSDPSFSCVPYCKLITSQIILLFLFSPSCAFPFSLCHCQFNQNRNCIQRLFIG